MATVTERMRKRQEDLTDQVTTVDGDPNFQSGDDTSSVSDTEVDAKGNKSPHRNFVNFLATDKVPDSIFGIPVVQDESQYTGKDLEFFRKNPKAAGFYDLGDEEADEDVP